MSVALLIERVDGEQVGDYLPIAGEAFFQKVWLPMCATLDLKLVPQFQGGRPFSNDDLPALIKELEKLQTNVNLDLEESGSLLKRVGLLIDRLHDLKGRDVELFIG